MSDNYVALLGTKGGPAIRSGSSMPTSNLFVMNGCPIVVDCGLGVTKGLVDQGMALKNLSLILISHMHSDHYLELGPLLHTAWTAGLKTKVKVYGPFGEFFAKETDLLSNKLILAFATLITRSWLVSRWRKESLLFLLKSLTMLALQVEDLGTSPGESTFLSKPATSTQGVTN